MKYSRAIAALVAVVPLSDSVSAKDEFPPASEVFRYAVESDGATLTVYWDVLPGYYLYKERMGVASTTPGVKLGKPCYPKGETHHDEYFGNQEIFRDDFKVTVPLSRPAAAREGKLDVKLSLQGCADAGLCYPPTVWNVKVKLPANAAPTVSPAS